jgi:hypothetical protein
MGRRRARQGPARPGWTSTWRCPVCGGKPDDYTYEPDEEQVKLGYPVEFQLCATCMSPLLEVKARP